MKSSPVEDVAAAIAESVQKNKWEVLRFGNTLHIEGGAVFSAWLSCPDASQAKRLAEMMRAPPTPVFAAMNLPELPAFPSIRGKA